MKLVFLFFFWHFSLRLIVLLKNCSDASTILANALAKERIDTTPVLLRPRTVKGKRKKKESIFHDLSTPQFHRTSIRSQYHF